MYEEEKSAQRKRTFVLKRKLMYEEEKSV